MFGSNCIQEGQPTSPVSTDQHMNAGQNGAAPGHFADMAHSLCAEFGDGSVILAPVSGRRFWCLVFDRFSEARWTLRRRELRAIVTVPCRGNDPAS